MPSSPSSSRRRGGSQTAPTPPSPMLLASPQPLCGPPRLLSLVRSVERGEEEDRPMRQQQWGEILDLLSDLEARLARGGIAGARGCDGGDVADRSSGNKRKLPAVVGDEGDDDVVASEARLWLTALTRTLSLGDQRGGSPTQKGQRRTRDKHPPPGAERVYCPPPAVVEAASDAITALCGHAGYHRRRAGGTSSADGPPDKRKRKKQKQRGGPTATGASTIPKGDDDDVDDADLVAPFASRWLSSLAGHAERCLSLLDGGGGHYFGIPDYGDAAVTSAGAAGGEDVAHCAASCLRACSSLVTLLGTGLSRAGGGGGGGGSSSSAPSLPARLHGLAWAAMGSYRGRRRRPPSSDSSRRWHPRVMRAGAVLASSLPLLGCTDGDGGDGRGGDGGRRGVRRFAPPAELWSEALRSCLDALDLAVRSAWSGSASSPSSSCPSPDADPDGWLVGLRAAVTDQGDRAAAVLCRVSALSALATCLLDMEGYPDGGTAAGTFTVRLPLGLALDVCGKLVGFPAGIDRFIRRGSGAMTVAAEKSLLSPVSSASIADPVRCAGHDLFAAVAMAASAPSNALIGHARGVVSMVDRTMASASSNAVRRSLSTTRRSGGARRGPGGGGGSSAVVRRRAMRSVKVALLALGSAAAPMLGRSALLIGGSLLETLVLGDDGRGLGDGGDRSTVGEGVELATEAIETLSAFFAVGGSFLPLPCRATLEGVLVSGLRSIDPAASGSASAPVAAGFSTTKVALLRLATDAVCSPWGDGGTGGGGALTAKLRHVASALRRDRDHAVAAAAHSAISVCDALYTPRAPPLFLVGHRSGETAAGSDDAAASGTGMGLLDRIESARVEASEAVDREASRGRATREDDDKALVGEEKSSPGEGEAVQLPRPMNPAPASSKEGDETNAESAETHGSATRDGVSVALAEDGGNTKHAPACDGGSTTNKERAKPVEDDEENGANDAAGKSSQTDGGVGSHSSCDADRERQTTDPPPASPDAGVKHATTSLAVAQLEADATTGIPELGTGGKFDPKLGGGEESSESGDDDFPPIVDCGPDEGDRL